MRSALQLVSDDQTPLAEVIPLRAKPTPTEADYLNSWVYDYIDEYMVEVRAEYAKKAGGMDLMEEMDAHYECAHGHLPHDRRFAADCTCHDHLPRTLAVKAFWAEREGNVVTLPQRTTAVPTPLRRAA